MPDLTGMKEKDAIALLESKGLVVNEADIVRQPSYKDEGTVTSQYPYEPKAPVYKGAEVTLTVSSGLPKDALEYTFNIVISPAVAGQTSEIRITYSDARGEDIEWGKKKINDTTSFSVKVVLDPNTEAKVSIFRDNQYTDTFSRTYDEVKSGADTTPETVPGAASQPTDQQAQTEETNGNGEPSTNTTTTQ
jgi:serine/threonine-protein kinase